MVLQKRTVANICSGTCVGSSQLLNHNWINLKIRNLTEEYEKHNKETSERGEKKKSCFILTDGGREK